MDTAPAKKFRKFFTAAMLIAIPALQGCLHMGTPEMNFDCRSCHVASLAPGAADFSAIYDRPSSHHPAGTVYPAKPDFNQPDKRFGSIAFFDRNGNEMPDSDEIQLFGKMNEEKIECASCHREHGTGPVSGGEPDKYYLRTENINSSLCLVCHKK